MNVLFFLHPGTNSRAFLADIIGGFAAAGHATFVWEIGPAMDLLRRQPQTAANVRQKISAEISNLIRREKIDLSVSLWCNALTVTDDEIIGGRSVTLFERIRSPHLMVWYDSPDRARGNSLRAAFKHGYFSSDYLFHYINNQQTSREMESVYNFKNVIARSYGVNAQMFRPIPDVQKDYDLIFCASYGDMETPTPAILSELTKDQPDLRVLRDEAARMQSPAIEGMVEKFPPGLRDAATSFVQTMAQMQLVHRTRPMLDRVVELSERDDSVAVVATHALEDPEVYASIANQIREIEIYERAFVFSYLSRFFKSAVFGKIDYSTLGCKADHLGPIAYDEQAATYARARVGLSVMRWQDERGLHVKPFEMTACGIACAAAHREGIDESFVDGKEIISFRTLGEARNKIAALINDPARLAEVSAAGMARTLRDHTWACWTRDVVSQIEREIETSARQAA